MSAPSATIASSSSLTKKAVHVTVTKDVPEENQDVWLSMAKELATETWKEAGCIAYDFVRSNGKSNRFVIVEEWESDDHLQAHFKTPHFVKFVPLMDEISSTVELDVSSKCLPVSRHDDGDNDDRKKRNGRILVLFDTSSGSTEQIASLIAEGAQLLDRIDVRVRVVPGPHTTWEDPAIQRDAAYPFATFSDVFWADAVACGTPTNLGCISYRMKQFWDEFSQDGGWGTTDGKIGTAFTSQGGHGGGGELACMAMKTVMMNFGFSVFGITDYVGFKDTMHYGSTIAKKPRDEIDKMKCRRQGLRLAELVAYYINGRDEANPRHTKEWDTQRWGFPGIPPKNADLSEIANRTKLPHVSVLNKQEKAPSKATDSKTAPAPPTQKQALIFTKMEDYVHDSTPAMAGWVLTKLHEFGWKGVITDDSEYIDSSENLAAFDLVIFLNNSGQIFKETKHLLAHIASGKGVFGVHAALASFLNGKDASGATILKPTCDVFETIFGCHFQNHPPIQTGTIIVEQSARHKLTPDLASLPVQFSHTDEFFNFTKNVADDQEVMVVAWAEESSYTGGLMGNRHPVAWYKEMGDNKAPIFYNSLGHFSHFYNGTGPDHVAIMLEAGLRFCCKE